MMRKEQFGKITLYHGDCMEYMAGLDEKAFDLAVVDPPYGIGESGGKHSRNRFSANEYDRKEWDQEAPSSSYFDRLRMVSCNQIIWGANHFLDNMPLNLSGPCWLVWDKQNGDCDFADCELAYTTFDSAVRRFSFRWAGMLQGDMKNKELRIHPTQKPVKLYDWILLNYAKPEHKILDTHLGSGSSAIAAHYFGCEFVGIELDEDYFDAACRRIESATKQEVLF